MKLIEMSSLKGNANEIDFNRFLAHLQEPFRFKIRIRGDLHNRKATTRYQRYGEWRIGDTWSARIVDTVSRLLKFCSRKLSASLIRRVADSVYHWCRKVVDSA